MKEKTLETKSFNFKQFSIYGGQSGMPVSTDGVLLGAWTQLKRQQNVLDIGTGTGLLTLMLAQRYPSVNLAAIDIDPDAIHAAKINFDHSPWSDRLQLYFGSVLEVELPEQFDAIICNPPYFNSGEQAAHSQRATARHTASLDHKALAVRCYELTTKSATASFILPIVEGEQFIELAKQSGWHLSRRLDVRTTARKQPTRLLFELSKDPGVQLDHQQLLIHDQSGYSEAFIALTQDFYLKM